MAKQGSTTPYWGQEPALRIAPSAVKTALRRWLWRKHCHYWQNLESCRQARAWVTSPGAVVCRGLRGLTRLQLRQVVGVLTGHCTLNRHLTTLKIKRDPTCSQCGLGEETSYHFLCLCDAYASHRLRIFGSDTLDPWEVQGLQLSEVLRFIKASGRLSRAD